MSETMVAWETMSADEPSLRDPAELWWAADKVVYSRRWETVSSTRTRIEREFDPETVRQLEASSERDLSVGGPELAAEAIRAGLVDELGLFLVPVLVGAGKRALPDGVRASLELLDERRFGNGTVYLSYGVR